MYLIFNADGSIALANTNDYIMEYSKNVNYIYASVLGIERSLYTAQVSYKLPDNTTTGTLDMSQATFEYSGITYKGWKLTVPTLLTALSGTLTLNIVITDGDGNILVSYTVRQVVNESTYVDGNIPNINLAQYESLMATLQSLSAYNLGYISSLDVLKNLKSGVATFSWTGDSSILDNDETSYFVFSSLPQETQYIFGIESDGVLKIGYNFPYEQDEGVWTWKTFDPSNYYNKTESDSKYVDLTSSQTITGAKKINSLESVAFGSPLIALSSSEVLEYNDTTPSTMDSETISHYVGMTGNYVVEKAWLLSGKANFTPTTDHDIVNKSYVDTSLLLKADKSDTYTKAQVDSAIASAVSSAYKYKGSVPTYDDLPDSGLSVGDVYNVEDTGDNYAWAGTTWDKLAGTVDLSDYLTIVSFNTTIADYYTSTQVDTLLSGKVDDSDLVDYYKKDETLLPSTNNTYDIGSSSYSYKDVYLSGAIDFGSNYKIYRNGTDIIVACNNSAAFAFRAGKNFSYNNFTPSGDNSKDLGGDQVRWRDLYLSRNLTDGTNSIPVANIQDKTKGLPYLTTAPTADNTDGGLKIVLLAAEPTTKYDGYLYLIQEE